MLDIDVTGKRFLEIGCGIGLPSLVLNRRAANITATDQHPCAESFLIKNTTLNEDNPIPFIRTSWQDTVIDLGRFDVIIGSDLLYEQQSIQQLSSFIGRHSKPDSRVIIVDPGRFLHAQFSRQMESHGYVYRKHRPEFSGYLAKPFQGMILSYTRTHED